MRDLRGKVAVVTGAASGIGLAMAERFAREGMKVVLADVEVAPLARAYELITRAGTEAIAVSTDVARWEQVENLARRTFDAFGAAHVLCNNAGVAGHPTSSWRLTQADWEWTLGVNLWGVIHGVRAFVPGMVAQGEGHVVNTASLAGLVTVPQMAPYCVTKHAVVAFSECLQHDLQIEAEGRVKVSVLCPAWVKTKITDSERNRPAPLSEGLPKGGTPHARAMATATRMAVATGIPPGVVADRVLSAVVEERFWIITHSKTKGLVEKRMRGIIDETTPSFDAFPPSSDLP